MEALANLFAGDDGLAGEAADHVPAAHFHGGLFGERRGGADLDLDAFGGLLADHEVVRLFHVPDDRFVHVVSRDADARALGDVGERHDGDLGRAAADVDDHGGGGLGDGESGTDGCGHGLLDEEDAASTGAFGGVEDGAFLDGGDPGGDGDDDAGADEVGSALDLADEVIEHRLGDLEVGDHAVLERTDGGDGAGGFAEHFLGDPADGVPVVESDDLVGALAYSDDGGFVEHDALTTHADERVAGTQVDPHIDAEPA